MSRNLTIVSIIGSIFLLLAVLVGLVWANISYARQHPDETDFLLPWLGARTFLESGNNPYGEIATQRAQITYYGRLAQIGEDPLRLDTPFPILLFYFPFALVKDHAMARGLWMMALEFALVALVFLSLQLTGWKPSRAWLLTSLLFALFWPHALISLLNGNAAIWTALIIAGSLVTLRAEIDELSGALLVLAAFQPLASGIFILFMLWWVVYHHRWRVIGGALMALGLLFLLAFIFLPGWFLPFARALVAEFRINLALTTHKLLIAWQPGFGGQLSWALTAALTIALFVEWRAVRNQDFRHFLWTASLTLVITPLLGMPISPVSYVVLFFPLTVFLSIVAERWRWGMEGFLLVLFFFADWALLFRFATFNGIEALRGVLFFFTPVVLLVGLYWVRWWAIHPPRTWLETVWDKTK